MEFKDILLEKQDGIARVTLNRPDVLNAFSLEMREEVGTAFEGFALDDNVRVVVLTGAGRAFCAGGDIKGWGELGDDGLTVLLNLARRAIKAITSLEKPVIAMVNGAAAGAGCNLALACDLIIASEKARFGETFVKVGLGPDWGGAYLLPRLVGMSRAKELLFTGKMIKATEAEALGLVNRVVPPEELEVVTMELATELATSPTRAIGLTKTFLHKAWQMDLNAALEYEGYVQSECIKTDDHKEGVQAFLEKRQANFTGH
ncbi:MAG: enoyl-CoA hydratase [Chloroflexota bacterium]|nr:enoyl-CoA hydratase [Chloroflexota bacterium]